MLFAKLIISAGILLDIIGAIMVYKYAPDPGEQRSIADEITNEHKQHMYELAQELKQRRIMRAGIMIMILGFVFQALPMLVEVVR